MKLEVNMWCPKCKTEYRAGITICADCHSELVEDLSEVKEIQEEEAGFSSEDFYEDKTSADASAYNFMQNIPKKSDYVKIDDNTDFSRRPQYSSANNTAQPSLDEELSKLSDEEKSLIVEAINNASKKTGIYATKRDKYEDNKSSAYTFLLIGSLGAIAVLLHIIGLFNFNLSTFSKLMINTVMGSMFVIFIIIGIFSAKNAAKFKKEAVEEEELTQQIMDFFTTNFNAASIDEKCRVTQLLDKPGADLYEIWMKRTTFIYMNIKKNFHDLSESYTEYVAEKIYNTFFGEDEIDFDDIANL